MYSSSILSVLAALLACSQLPRATSAPIPQMLPLGLGNLVAAFSFPANTDLPTTLSEGILPTSMFSAEEIMPTATHDQNGPLAFSPTIADLLPTPTLSSF